MKNNSIIYFDNAATTRTKPQAVCDAFQYYVQEIGVSPGRGSHMLAVEASRCLYQSRRVVASHFGCPIIKNVIFTKNATEASNLFLKGFLEEGDHVLISSLEHNATLRPLHKLREEGRIEYDILSLHPTVDWKANIDQYAQTNTRLCILSLASNVTGLILYSSEIIDYLHKKDIKVLLDTTQGAGRIELNMKQDKIDFLIFTGHKDLYGFPGTGGLCSLERLTIEALIQGGTGVHAETFTNPDISPEKYEAGTPNMPSIWSLKAGIQYIYSLKDEIIEKEDMLYTFCLELLQKIPRVIIYGNHELKRNLPIISFNIEGMDCQEIAFYLNQNHICVRSGLHCSILAHRNNNTEGVGTVRVSLDYHNSLEEIKRFIAIIKRIAKG